MSIRLATVHVKLTREEAEFLRENAEKNIKQIQEILATRNLPPLSYRKVVFMLETFKAIYAATAEAMNS